MRQQHAARHKRVIIIRRQAIRWISIARRQHWYQAGHNYAWWANARHRHALRVRMLRQRNARANRIRIMRIKRARMIRMRRMQIIRQRKIAVMKRRAQHWITIARRQGWYRAGLSWTFWSNARAVQNLRVRWTAVKKAQQRRLVIQRRLIAARRARKVSLLQRLAAQRRAAHKRLLRIKAAAMARIRAMAAKAKAAAERRK